MSLNDTIQDSVKSFLSQEELTPKLSEQECNSIIERFEKDYYEKLSPKNQALVPLCDKCRAAVIIGYELSSQRPEKTSYFINVPNQSNTVSVSSDHMWLLKSYVSNVQEFIDTNSETNVWRNIQLEDDQGRSRIEMFTDVEYRPGGFLFMGMQYHLLDSIAAAPIPEAKDILNPNISEEFRAILIENNPHLLTEVLTKVDTYIHKKEDVFMQGVNRTDGNVGVYDLFKGTINDVEVAYIRCYDYSTDRMFLLGVLESYNTSKDAAASLCQVPSVLKDSLVSIARQGEIYSLVFDEGTTERLERGEIEVNSNTPLVSLSGDEYFSMLTYEY